MDQQRRLLVFGLVSFLTFYGWLFLGPKFFPEMFPKPPAEVAEIDGSDPEPVDGESTDNAGEDSSANDGEPDKDNTPALAAVEGSGSEDGEPTDEPAEPDAPKLPDHETRTVVLGSPGVDSGYVLQVELTSVGASVQSATLTDPRYPVAENPEKLNPRPQLRVVC